METKTVKTQRRKYDADFKKEVMKMVESGRPVYEVAQSLGIGHNLIYHWKKQLNKKVFRGKNEPDVFYDDEKAAMQKRIRELEAERDILKKALGIFSRVL